MLQEWFLAHTTLLWWLGLLSILMFVGSLIALPMLVIRIPVDYFTRLRHPPARASGWRLGLHVLKVIVKNCLGLVFLLAGIAMLVLPGQGILTMLLGLTLLDLPGKSALEWRLVRQPMVWQSLNWLRTKAHHPPLEWPETETPGAHKASIPPSRQL